MSAKRYVLGIDLGTSSVKAVVVSEKAKLICHASSEYPIITPKIGWAEQDPKEWWKSTQSAVRSVVNKANVPVTAIGLSGQMHGTVLIGKRNHSIGPAIIWPDQRSSEEVDQIVDTIGREALASITGNLPATGFMCATLLWMKKYQLEQLDKTRHCLLPKDYIRYLLTGEIATDASDGSGTVLFDIHKRAWSDRIIDKLGLPRAIFPQVQESADVAGYLNKNAAKLLDLPENIPVVTGCADQVAQAIGNGLLNPGNASLTLGSGGQLFVPINNPIINVDLDLHIFCHAPANRWYILGAMLSAGLSLRWLRDLLQMSRKSDAYIQLSELADDVEPGSDGLLFLPYLAGERCPVRDPFARGGFVGLVLRHNRSHLARAIMEGVAFAFRQILDTILKFDIPITQLLAAGNGLSNHLWRQIVADVLNKPLFSNKKEEHAATGAALIASLGVGIYSNYEQLSQAIFRDRIITNPIQKNIITYEEQYHRFISLYPLLKPIFHELTGK